MSEPTDDAIVLSMLGMAYSDGWSHRLDGWFCASEIRGALTKLGFSPQTQQVAAWLGRLSREECPMVERRKGAFNELEYRVTRFGLTQIDNRFPGLRQVQPEVSVPRDGD